MPAIPSRSAARRANANRFMVPPSLAWAGSSSAPCDDALAQSPNHLRETTERSVLRAPSHDPRAGAAPDLDQRLAEKEVVRGGDGRPCERTRLRELALRGEARPGGQAVSCD